MTMSKLVSIGKILNFHGIKGEIRLGFTAGRESIIKSLKQVFVYVDNAKRTFDVQSVRFHKNFAIVKFNQINSINDVMEVKGLLVHISEDVLKSRLDKDEFLVNDLLNMSVYDEDGNKIGRVSDLGENKANNILEIEKQNGVRFMVPFVKEWVPIVDTANKKIIINYKNGIDNTIEQDNL